jgi:DNA-binding protein HU-beta
MNKSELTQQLVDRSGLPRSAATQVVEGLFGRDGVITNALRKGEKVQITGFGSFEVRERGARKGRDPRTGKEVDIKAGKSPAFRVGKRLKDSLA